MNDSLQTSLTRLRLSGMATTLDVRLQEAAGHQLGHGEFLELVLQDELLVRNQRQIQRRPKAAGFRERRTLDEFDFSFNPSVKRRQIFELATGRFIREARDILLIGPPGVGKSHIAQALGYQAIKNGSVVLYRSIFDLVRDFLHDEALSGQEKLMDRYLRPDLLIIDDMGMKQLPKRSGEYLFEIIMRRYQVRSTLMTSNRPLEDWGKLIGDVPSATAILDRFLHNAEVIAMTGASYRLRNRAAEQKASTEPAAAAVVAAVEKSSAAQGAAPSIPPNVPAKQKGRQRTADGERLSPPEDTEADPPMSSDGGVGAGSAG
jgi:DNA replication protein DnaC